jgi:hypothetical protein
MPLPRSSRPCGTSRRPRSSGRGPQGCRCSSPAPGRTR